MQSIRNDLNPVCSYCGEPMLIGPTEERECIRCHKKMYSKECCTKGHYVCDDCRRKSASIIIIDKCMASKSKDPISIAMEIMDDRSIHMHDLKHHTLVGASLMTAYKNSGGDIELEASLREMDRRGSWFPGGICGLAGTCGAAASAGAFYSIITGTTPHSQKTWSETNRLVANCILEISNIEGPRCCKRNSFIAIKTTADYVSEKLGIKMEIPQIHCTFSERNDECVKEKCPFHK